MAAFLFPDVGEGIHEGKLIEWKVKEGDTVKADQVLCEIETDKAVVEIPSPQAGVIVKQHALAGSIITVGNPLVTFADGNTPTRQPIPSTEFKRPIESGTSKVESTLVPTPPQPHEHDPPIVAPADIHNQQGPTHISLASTMPLAILATPSTRKLARDKGLNINTIQGTGAHGRITNQDVLNAGIPSQPVVASIATPIAIPAALVEAAPTRSITMPVATNNAAATITPYEGRRKLAGEHLTEAQRVPAVSLFARADATALVSLRERQKGAADSRGVKLTYLALFAKAALAALRAHPIVNSALTQRGIETSSAVHLGIAVDHPKGLVVPVVRDAHMRSVLGLATEIGRLAELARTDKLSVSDMRGSTFSISSIGPLRVEGFTPMLNTPDSGILGIGAILEEPRVVNGTIVVRKVVTLSMTFDHRVYDGAEAARFLSDVVRFVEDPELLLIEGA